MSRASAFRTFWSLESPKRGSQVRGLPELTAFQCGAHICLARGADSSRRLLLRSGCPELRSMLPCQDPEAAQDNGSSVYSLLGQDSNWLFLTLLGGHCNQDRGVGCNCAPGAGMAIDLEIPTCGCRQCQFCLPRLGAADSGNRKVRCLCPCHLRRNCAVSFQEGSMFFISSQHHKERSWFTTLVAPDSC